MPHIALKLSNHLDPACSTNRCYHLLSCVQGACSLQDLTCYDGQWAEKKLSSTSSVWRAGLTRRYGKGIMASSASVCLKYISRVVRAKRHGKGGSGKGTLYRISTMSSQRMAGTQPVHASITW